METRVYDPQSREFLDLERNRALSVGRSVSQADILIPSRRALEIGRAELNPYISGIHALVRFDGKSLILLDKSRNGTYIRDFRIKNDSWKRLIPNSWALLSEGYEIGFGRESRGDLYVLQLTSEEAITKTLQEEQTRKFVEIISNGRRAHREL
jgi:pSer/pThr/pTyr-binding forkhead associated (FHA) protein